MTHNKDEFIRRIEEITGLMAESVEDNPSFVTLTLGDFVVIYIFYTSESGWKVWHVRINLDIENKLYKLHLKS